MVYKVRNCFHAVGKGTLFSGQIINAENGEVFNWIYDCGSTSIKVILATVNNLPFWFGCSQTIDMLVISHFDNDHVNGLEILLQNFHVKKLVLPYTDWPQTIREISILGKKGITPSLALFQLNPAKWLQVNDLGDRISEIVLVEGGGDYPSNAVDSVFFDFDTPLHRSSIKVEKTKHFQPMNDLRGSFEFMFYNAEKNFSELGLIYELNGQTCAKKSGKPLSIVKAEIEKTISSLGLDQPKNTLPVNWRKILKDCYEQHFGHTGKAKNNISLCMYAAPLKRNPKSDTSRHATLFTGDINLSCNVVDDMEIHFGTNRWQSLLAVQIPHHGSQHSWTVGNTCRFTPARFVQCVSPTKNHPHLDVTADLQNYKGEVYEANRKSPVCYCYKY